MPTKCCVCDVALAAYDWSGRPDSQLEIVVKVDGADFCSECARKHNGDPTLIAEIDRRKAIQSVMVTTTPSLDGYRIAKVVDVISAECVFGMNVFKDLFVALSDFFGGRSGASQNALRTARQTCIYEIKAEAHQLGANAVIGIDLDYSEFSGQGKSMLFLVATGTAVVLERLESPAAR